MVIRVLLLLILVALPARADSLRMIIPDIRPVVGEMIPITIRGEYTGPISIEKMVFPDSASYDWMQVSRDKWADERVDGKLFRTFERHIAVFPRQPGTLTIGPVTHTLTKSVGMTRPVSEVMAQPITLAVLPYPGGGRPLAARNVTVTDEFSKDPSKLREGETFTRKITLKAEGTMAHLLPPRPLIREPWLISFAAPELRETHLTKEGPVAIAIWEWTLRPHTGERGSLMPIQFPWYSTLLRKREGALTLPVEIGLASFGENFGGAASPPARLKLQAAALGLTGLAVALIAGLMGFAPANRQALAARLRRLRPNPHKRALRRAAANGDLMTLRRAAQDYAAAETRLGRQIDPTPIAELDSALFAPNAAPENFDRQSFLRRLLTRRKPA